MKFLAAAILTLTFFNTFLLINLYAEKHLEQRVPIKQKVIAAADSGGVNGF